MRLNFYVFITISGIFGAAYVRPSCALVLKSSVTLGATTSGDSSGNAIARNLTTGDIYVAGAIINPIDLGTSVLSQQDIFVAQFDSSLVLKASATLKYNSLQSEEGFAVAIDASGNVLVTGYVVENNSKNLFLAKLDSSLALISSVTLNGAYSGSQDEGRGVAVYGNSIYVTGRLDQQVGGNLFLGHFNSSLVLQSSAVVSGPYGFYSKGNALVVDASGNIFVTGLISTGAYPTNEDIYVAKFNSSLVLQASVTLHAGARDAGHGIAITGDNLYITGQTTLADIFVGKFNASLVLQATQTISGEQNSYDIGYSIAFDPSGNVNVAGVYSIPESYGGANYYIAKFDPSLVFVSSTNWTSISGSSWDQFNGLVIDSNGFNYAAGWRYRGSARDIYVAKLSDPITTPILSGTSAGTSSITWSWLIDVSSQTGYRVALATDTAAYVSTFTLAASATMFMETGLSTNTAYSRVVIALEPASNSTSSAKTIYTLAAVPEALAASQVYTSSLTLTWSANTNPSSTTYKLSYWQVGNATAAVETSSLTHTLTGLGGGNTYYFQVQAKNGDAVATTASATISTVTMAPQPVSQVYTPGAPSTITYNPSAGEVTLSIPDNSYSQAVTFTLTTPGVIPAASSPLADLKATGVAVEITPSVSVTANSDIAVSISYRDIDVSGMDEYRLICARYDTSQAYWVPIIDSTADPASNRVTCRTRAFSIYQVMEAASQAAFSQAKIYPNPFIPSRGHTQIKLSNLPADSAITVYTLSGEKLAEFYATAAGMAVWDARSFWGEAIASGIYLVHISGGGESEVFKIGVER